MRMFQNEKKSNIGIICLILVFVLMTGFFAFLFVNCISLYSKFDIDYNDLVCEELTFKSYDKVYLYKGDCEYIIYFEEYIKPFEISTIADKKLNKTALENLSEDEILHVYYRESSSLKYEYEICEFSHNSTVLLSLTDYIQTNQSNQLIGIIMCPIMIISSVFVVCIYMYMLKPINPEKLGKIKVEYVLYENVIRIYNSASVCSLVVNDEIVDQYLGIMPTKFCLKANLNINGKDIPVEAKMGIVNIRLYCDGKLVAKKFMG